MKTLQNFAILGMLTAAAAFAQNNSLVATTLSAASTATAGSIQVTAATGITAGSFSSGTAGSVLYVVEVGQQAGEAMVVTGVSSTTITVQRGTKGTRAAAHASGALVLIGTAANWFYSVDPIGACTRSATYVAPYVNILTGRQWICSTESNTWVPGFGNQVATAQIISSSATASVAGATAIAGPFLKISGTNAITSFTMGVGWHGDNFCVYPTGAFTYTATNNIAKAGTAVADRVLCFIWDVDAAKFSPTY